jgi:hypothetical protein
MSGNVHKNIRLFNICLTKWQRHLTTNKAMSFVIISTLNCLTTENNIDQLFLALDIKVPYLTNYSVCYGSAKRCRKWQRWIVIFEKPAVQYSDD